MRSRHLLAAAVPLIVCAALPLVAPAASTDERLSELQQKIDDRERRSERGRARATVLTTDIAAQTDKIAGLQARVDALAGRLSDVESRYQDQRRELDQIQDRLRAKRAERARLKRRLDASREVLARRLVLLYQADPPDLVSVVLNANGFAELLERADFLARIGSQDRRILRRVSLARSAAERATRTLSALADRQERLTEQVAGRRAVLADANKSLVDRRTQLERARAERSSALSSVRGSTSKLERETRSLQAAQQEIRDTLRGTSASTAGSAPAAPVRAGSGKMIWPVDGTITSPYCEQRSWENCHPGLDIGLAEGTPIRAADGGRVALQQSEAESGGYGNFTCVQHSASLATCYAHQSRFGTSLGSNVKQGEIIGYVGSTGRSTGPHLHFEVRLNGTPTSPLDYL